MQHKITSKQIMYSGAISIISTSLMMKQLYSIAKNDAWIAVIGGFLLSLAIFLMYAFLVRKFPDKSLMDINEAVFGLIIGKIISALYIFYIFSIACLNTHILVHFIKAFVLPTTPLVLILFLFIAVCAWGVRKGPVNQTKYSALLVYFSIAVILINTLLLYRDIDFKNLQPSFSLPLEDYLIGTHTVTVLPFCDLFVLLVFRPYMLRPEEFTKAITKGLSIGAAVLLFIVFRDITVLSSGTEINTYPSFTTIRNIDVGDILTRIDIVYISILVALMFYKVSILFTAGISGIQHVMKFDSYEFLVYIFSALLIVYTLIVFRSVSEYSKFLMDGTAVLFLTFFLLILPMVTLITALCRGFYRKNTPTAAIEP